MAKLDPVIPSNPQRAEPRISSLDYNAIRNSVVALLGPGTGQRGYGQTIASSPVTAGNVINKSHWDLLRYDLINIKVHQDGATPPIVALQPNAVIRYGATNPNTNYETLAAQADSVRFNIGNGQSILNTRASTTYTSAWSTTASATLTVTFSTANAARYFFNSGGKVQFASSRQFGSTSRQNTAWTQLLSSVGTQSFGGATPLLANFYTLTTSYQTFYQNSQSTPYSNNYYQLSALCNVANNSTGTATSITFRIIWKDDYVDPDTLNTKPSPPSFAPNDVVDGTLSIAITELTPSGIMVPSGSFTVTSPSYSLSSISAS